jgi:hypothetical protein
MSFSQFVSILHARWRLGLIIPAAMTLSYSAADPGVFADMTNALGGRDADGLRGGQRAPGRDQTLKPPVL